MARDARRYKHRIAVYQQEASDDGYGGQVLTDTFLANAWADIVTIRVDKVADYGLNYGQEAIKVFVRKHGQIDWRSGLLTIEYQGKVWTVQTVTQTNLWQGEYEIVCNG